MAFHKSMAALMLSLLMAGCKQVEGHVESNDACAAVTKDDVQKVLGATVTHMIIEAPHAMSISQGRVMQTLSSCEYSLDPVSGKPHQVTIRVDAYGEHIMAGVNFGPWKDAHHVGGIGDEAWQSDEALRVNKGNVILTIETPYTPAEPTSGPASPAEDIQLYPKFQLDLAKIALERL